MNEFLKWFVPYIVSVALALGAGRCFAAEPLRIDGPTQVGAHKHVTLKAVGDIAGAALQWDVSPDDRADLIELPDGRLILTGPPGEYRIRLRTIRIVDGKTTGETARWVVVIGNGSASPPAPAKPMSMIPDCIGQLVVGRAGCTATPIYPRRPDGRWDVLTASHCTGDVGTKGTLTLKDGRTFSMTVTARSTVPDLTWFVTDRAIDTVPYAVLASADAAPGTAIWQAGYGEDRPTVRKDGTVIASDLPGRAAFMLSVSHGDSGGPIFRADSNEIVGVVCCTSGIARTAKMYGGSATSASRLRPGQTVAPLYDGDGSTQPVWVYPVHLSLLPSELRRHFAA